MKDIWKIVVGGLGFVVILIGLWQAMWTAKEAWDEVATLRGELELFDTRLDEMKAQTIRFESVKAELEIIEQRILSQDTKIENANAKADTQVEGLRADIAALASSLPKGVAMPDVECVPLNKRIRLSQHSSVEFCDSDLIVSVSNIRLEDNVVNIGSSLLTVPRTTDQGFSPCQVDFLSINRDDPKNPTLDIRGRCPE